VAIQEELAEVGAAPWFHAFFPPAEITDDYAWAIPKDGGRLLLGAALPPHGAAANFARLKVLLTASGFPADRLVLRRDAALLLRPARWTEMIGARNGAALIGEAGGWVSPSSGEGISFALHTALLLAEVWHGGRTGVEARYNNALRGLRQTLLGKRLKSRVIFSPLVRRALLRSGIAALR
jgi:flavin-dependent dehydrogenase